MGTLLCYFGAVICWHAAAIWLKAANGHLIAAAGLERRSLPYLLLQGHSDAAELRQHAQHILLHHCNVVLAVLAGWPTLCLAIGETYAQAYVVTLPGAAVSVFPGLLAAV